MLMLLLRTCFDQTQDSTVPSCAVSNPPSNRSLPLHSPCACRALSKLHLKWTEFQKVRKTPWLRLLALTSSDRKRKDETNIDTMDLSGIMADSPSSPMTATAAGNTSPFRGGTEQQKQQGILHSVPLQEQLRLRAMRSQVAMSLKQCLGECRVALKFYMLGWTGTLPSVSHTKRQERKGKRVNDTWPLTRPHPCQAANPDAVANAKLLQALRDRVDKLNDALAPYSMGSISTVGYIHGDTENKGSSSSTSSSSPQLFITIDMESLHRIDYVRDKLMTAELARLDGHNEPLVREVIAAVVDEIEKDARVARLLPPLPPSQEESCGVTIVGGGGWAWSWRYDDWFGWNAGLGKWVAASQAEFKVDSDYLI